jgi:hypothetical protein
MPTIVGGQMPLKISNRGKLAIIAGMAAFALFLLLVPPLHQDQSYHQFADHRTILGIPNFWDVISNFPFLIVGAMGLVSFRDFGSRLLFLGVLFTAFGSGYYHLAPDNARLFWDRLPMTIVFMSLLALAMNQRILVVPFVILGIVSVIWWRLTDNLWLYGFVQFVPMIVLLIIAIRREPGLWPVFIFYGLSKLAEHFDKQIYSVSPLSGHTIKHLLAGIASWYIYRWIQLSRGMPKVNEAESYG